MNDRWTALQSDYYRDLTKSGFSLAVKSLNHQNTTLWYAVKPSGFLVRDGQLWLLPTAATAIEAAEAADATFRWLDEYRAKPARGPNAGPPVDLEGESEEEDIEPLDDAA
jgi:hypothetical protein